MKRIIHVCIIISLLSIFTFSNVQAYGPPPVKTLSDILAQYNPTKYCIIYGHFDSKCDSHLESIVLRKYPLKNPQKIGFAGGQVLSSDDEWTVIEDDGYFWTVVKPGDYFLCQILTWESGLTGNEFATTFQESGARVISIKPGEFIYWGRVEFIMTQKRALFSPGGYKARLSTESSEKEMFAHLLEAAKGTKWESIVEAKQIQTNNAVQL